MLLVFDVWRRAPTKPTPKQEGLGAQEETSEDGAMSRLCSFPDLGPWTCLVKRCCSNHVLLGSPLRIGIVHSRWNAKIVDALVDGTKQAMDEAGVAPANVVVQSVPGAWELVAGVRGYVLLVSSFYQPASSFRYGGHQRRPQDHRGPVHNY